MDNYQEKSTTESIHKITNTDQLDRLENVIRGRRQNLRDEGNPHLYRWYHQIHARKDLKTVSLRNHPEWKHTMSSYTKYAGERFYVNVYNESDQIHVNSNKAGEPQWYINLMDNGYYRVMSLGEGIFTDSIEAAIRNACKLTIERRLDKDERREDKINTESYIYDIVSCLKRLRKNEKMAQ